MLPSSLVTLLLFVCCLGQFPNLVSFSSYDLVEEDAGSLTGDVQNWAMLLQNYILQLASDGIKRQFTQSLFDKANYTYVEKNGDLLVQQVKDSLGDYFSKKRKAAQRLAEKVVELYDIMVLSNRTSGAKKLSDLSKAVYMDSDIPSRFPDDLYFSPYFKQPVSQTSSSVKISDEVPRDDRTLIETVAWTIRLESVFKQNAKDDPHLRWQYFGSTTGMVRFFPGREWDTNFAGFYNDYDARVRPWYIAATSGPKDVIIILDCSLSMLDNEKFRIAQAVAKTVINTLTRQDYVNVICARASHWDDVGKWHYYSTDALSCQQDHLVQATTSHRKDLIEKIYKLKPGGTSELEKGFEMAFDLLNGKMKTGCQAVIVFVTDGKDTDGEKVRCGPGYYTRSGYVPGPICKYNWTKVWDLVNERNKHSEYSKSPVSKIEIMSADSELVADDVMENARYRHLPLQTFYEARLFSYLVVDDGEAFPGRLACSHRGSFRKLINGENLISQMSNYFEFLSGNSKNSNGLWTSPYLDAWGLGLLVTHAIPCLSKVDGKTIGVVGIDATLDEIENFLNRHQWGTVYSFLMNKEGETIFHPRLKPSEKVASLKLSKFYCAGVISYTRNW